jgi:hypothetical protein
MLPRVYRSPAPSNKKQTEFTTSAGGKLDYSKSLCNSHSSPPAVVVFAHTQNDEVEAETSSLIV